MFRIKICGVTSPRDASVAVHAGADAIGLNFFERSPRYVSSETASTIAAVIPAHVAKVGVFVNATADAIRTLVADLGLDYVQLHGDEPPQFNSEQLGAPVVRALRLAEADAAPITAYLRACQIQQATPAALLIDAKVPGLYGGSGQALDWAELRLGQRDWDGTPWVLAGGLRAENVAGAIELVLPTAVDVASGVESSPGVKDSHLVRDFVSAARAAFLARQRRE